MAHAVKHPIHSDREPVRVLGRGLRAERGVRLTIRTLREAAGKTQSEVATASQIDQADISRIESRKDFDDYQLSTLRRYISAIGGKLDLVATFGNKRIILSGAQTMPKSESSRSQNSRPTKSK